jgi:hypothetical protein
MQLDSDKELYRIDPYADSGGDWLPDDYSYSPPDYSAPANTAAGTGGALSKASGGLEDLLKLAVGGYTSVLGAKAAVDTAKVNLATANRSGVPTNTAATPDTIGGIPTKTLLIGGGIAAVAVLGLVLASR